MRLQCSGEDLTIANFMVANSDGDGVFDREFFLGRPDPLSTDRNILYWNDGSGSEDPHDIGVAADPPVVADPGGTDSRSGCDVGAVTIPPGGVRSRRPRR